MDINIPIEAIQLAVDAHTIQMKWSLWSVESRAMTVQKMEYQFAEIVMERVYQEYLRLTKHLPYGNSRNTPK